MDGRPVLLAPHYDDETLFAAFTILRIEPVVITVCSHATAQLKYGITRETRRAETSKALWHLGVGDWFELGLSDVDLDWDLAQQMLQNMDEKMGFGTVYAPLWEEGGHEQHNQVARIAKDLYGDGVRWYATYRRGEGRSEVGELVEVEPGWYSKKLRAMACYRSQVNLDNTRPWFNNWDKEWVS